MPDVTIAGHRLDYRLARPGTAGAPTLVFLHEGLGCVASWRDFPETLAARTGCGALVYSRWGYGRSERRSLPWAPEFIDDEALRVLPALLAAFQLERPALVGHSDGAVIALMAAAAEPHRFSAVITLAAHVIIEAATIRGLRRTQARYARGTLRDGLAHLHGANCVSVYDGWLANWIRADRVAWQIRDRLAAITCPILAIQGADDHFGTPAQLRVMAEYAGGRFESLLIPNSGHSPHRDRPEIVLEAATQFLTKELACA